jgi:glyoxylase-like metal-dependent hydrolase (beta-lactamase superfamily II)
VDEGRDEAGPRLLPAPYLPSPATAAEPFPVVEVAAGVFVRRGAHEDFTSGNRGGIANLAFVVGGSAVAVVDSGGSRAEGDALLAAIRARTPLPVAYVINTHLHPDHVLGNAAFRDSPGGTAFVGHERLGRRLAEAGPHYLASMRRILGEAASPGPRS